MFNIHTRALGTIASIVGFTLLGATATQTIAQESPMASIQKDMPNNWGKWGKEDQIGALNYLDAAQVKRGLAAAKQGTKFTLQLPMIHGVGPVFPGRVPVMHFMSQDEGLYSADKSAPLAGGMKYSDDAVFMYLQGTTHVDALGHAWYDDKVYNGKSSDTTVHGHSFVSISELGDEGIVGRGILLDIGRLKGDKNHRLAPNECVTLADLKAAEKRQKTKVEKRDILVIRTGSMGRFYDKEDAKNWSALTEPGLCYGKDLIKWIDDMEIPVIASDNLAVEKSFQKIDGKDYVIPLHGALIRDLGVVLTELYWLDDIAEASAKDGQYSFFFSATPLKMEGGTGSPVNPLAIR
ncbi:cyclase family protein [Bowmanella sp. Y26]|uniref:cyclase family protein n=1 Tax=Bowmanella yangjiangensis TaxID=2811230 RepID=UPI001BDC8D9D|nr:cyclase family protein [Bowmanella yangjiangensis]MBT1064388.1 cyclase family protein [Bowmanella yangjiangensis]